MNLDPNTLGGSEPEVHARVRRRRVTRGRRHRAYLIADDHASADAVAVAPRSGQPDIEPAVVGRRVVEPELHRRSERQDDEVETAVAVEVRGTAAAMHGDPGVEPRASRRTAKACASVVHEEAVRLLPGDRLEVSDAIRSEEHTSELQSRGHLVCRLLLEKKKKNKIQILLIKKKNKINRKIRMN